MKYKSGANFSGHVQNYKKIGSGTFTWPDGSFYVGEYVDNYRHGNGKIFEILYRVKDYH